MDEDSFAMVEVLGVRRKVNVDLLRGDGAPLVCGDWVLVHVGFAMSRIGADQAAEELAFLRSLGEFESAQEELLSDPFAAAPPERNAS